MAELRTVVSRSLRGGVVLSGLLIAAGLTLGALGAHRVGIDLVRAGLLALIATPVLRIAVLAAAFARERQWRFFCVCAALLVLLGLSAAAGLAR
jgi:uncharacterized membrane protein